MLSPAKEGLHCLLFVWPLLMIQYKPERSGEIHKQTVGQDSLSKGRAYLSNLSALRQIFPHMSVQSQSHPCTRERADPINKLFGLPSGSEPVTLFTTF